MKPPSERARLVLERYKESAAMGAADKTRLGDVIRERVLRGDLPRFDVQAGTPIVPSATVAQGLAGSTLAKIAAAILALGAAGGLGYQLQQRSQPKAVASAVHTTLEPPAAVISATPPVVSEAAIEGTLPERLANVVPSVEPGKRRPEALGASAVEPTIDEEVKLVTGAQAALRSGDPGRALTLLNEHAKRFPSGKLATLRQVTHIMAVCQSGRAQQAREEARNFLAKNPSSPFAARVNGVCATGK